MAKEEKQISLDCEKCGHKNEPERVYCHECGEKLDRSSLLTPENTKGFEKPEDTQKRIANMMNPHKGEFGSHIKTFLQIIVLAAVVAAISLFWLEPDNVPPAKSDTLPDRDAGDLWSRAMQAKPAVAITLTDFEINHYAARVLKASDSSIPGYKFDRAFIHCEPGVVTLTAQRSLWDFPMYSSVSFRPVVKDGNFTAEVVAIRFGRLGIDPKLKFIGDLALGAIYKAFEKEGKQLDRIAEVLVGEGAITISTKPQP